ncbi:MAG: phenylalanine--tRNA ligase subunit beta [candidate division Zixibacteria bacterium]|nr:phenylalanine--tRNA ligase subunit beta [candidate division Zixibacteria bacterium]
MQTSYKWLLEWVDFSFPPQELAERLLGIGLAVETVEPLFPKLDGVLVGRVELVEKHPEADRLSVCTVSLGLEKKRVVCGAPNVESGQKVAYAPAGSKLPNGAQIGFANIRGVESAGMICSEFELGLGADKEGIMVLDSGVVGKRLADELGLEDWKISVELTPNRPDCLSVAGIAREIAALVGGKLKRPKISLKEAEEPASRFVSVETAERELCPRYAARLVRKLKIGPSPFWLKKKLIAAGMRPINNVVDVTNLVMLEFGHPLHAFDFQRFGSQKVRVRRAKEGEKLVTLDGVERSLTSEDLLITNGQAGTALAGVMGGRDSEISDGTSQVLLEAAYFDPRTIRRTRKRLGLATESAIRFEKGTDINVPPLALDRSAQLLSELAGGEVLSGIVDAYPKPKEPTKLTLRPLLVSQILGAEISSPEVSDYLSRLEMSVTPGKELSVIVPTFRVDIKEEADLVEEVARLYGYDRIPSLQRGSGPLAPRFSFFEAAADRLRELLVGSGFSEAVTSPLGNPKVFAKAGFAGPYAALANPLSEELSVLRPTLLVSLADVAGRNQAGGNPSVRMFELSKTFRPGSPPEEGWRLGLVFSSAAALHWREKGRSADFYDLAGILEKLFARFLHQPVRLTPRESLPGFFEREFELIAGGQVLGLSGELSPEWTKELHFKKPCFLAEIDWELFLKLAGPEKAYHPFSRFPAVERDAALVAPLELLVSDILDEIRNAKESLLESFELFDLYTGPQAGEGKKSLALSFRYRSAEKTLTDAEADAAHERLVGRLVSRFGLVWRRQ